MSDQTQKAAAYFRGHRRVTRLDLYAVGVMRPDREVERLVAAGWDLLPFTSGEDVEDPRLGGWLVGTRPGHYEAPTAPQGTLVRTRWVCTKANCGLDGQPDDAFTMLDEKGRMTTGACPKHGRPVLLKREG